MTSLSSMQPLLVSGTATSAFSCSLNALLLFHMNSPSSLVDFVVFIFIVFYIDIYFRRNLVCHSCFLYFPFLFMHSGVFTRLDALRVAAGSKRFRRSQPNAQRLPSITTVFDRLIRPAVTPRLADLMTQHQPLSSFCFE